MPKKLTMTLLVALLLAALLAACAPPAAPAPAAGNTAPASDKPAVFGAYATAIEEPWDGVIHAALNKAQADGKITYTYTDDIGYSGDMERVPVSYTHLRAHETVLDLVCRLLLEKKTTNK